MYVDEAALAKSLAIIYQENVKIVGWGWTNVECRLEHQAACETYAATWEIIHSVVRCSSMMTLSELILL